MLVALSKDSHKREAQKTRNHPDNQQGKSPERHDKDHPSVTNIVIPPISHS